MGTVTGILFASGEALSGGFEADGADELIGVVDHTMIEAIEVRTLVRVEAAAAAYGIEEAGSGLHVQVVRD